MMLETTGVHLLMLTIVRKVRRVPYPTYTVPSIVLPMSAPPARHAGVRCRTEIEEASTKTGGYAALWGRRR